MSFDYLAEQFATLAWGPWLVIFLVGSGIFFLIFSGLRPFRYLPHAFALLTGKYSKASDVGDVSHFKALTAALSGTIGLGNIAGVAVAIQLGGPGMLIGMGGGAASSMATGENSMDLDFDSVQRGNPEIQRRCQEVIDRCWGLGPHNTILSIHDV